MIHSNQSNQMNMISVCLIGIWALNYEKVAFKNLTPSLYFDLNEFFNIFETQFLYLLIHCRIVSVHFKQNNVGKASGTLPGATKIFNKFWQLSYHCLVRQQVQKDGK